MSFMGQALQVEVGSQYVRLRGALRDRGVCWQGGQDTDGQMPHGPCAGPFKGLLLVNPSGLMQETDTRVA